MVSQDVYTRLDEGLGGAYERFAYSNVMKRLADLRGSRSFLELNATYIAGIPGFNSCLLVQAGYDVTVTVHTRDYEDTKHAWDLLGLADRVRILEWNNDFHTEFRDGEFDFVWNHLAFEHYENPAPLIEEMKRVSKDVVMNLTLSPWNPGVPIHWITHKLQGKKWDHGSLRNSMTRAMKKAHKQARLSFVESGGCDCPPWMDTVDAKMGESMTYFDAFPDAVKSRWIWCSANPECQTNGLVRMLLSWERDLPDWFRSTFAHHLYVASTMKSFTETHRVTT